jgi:hypothetical protein
MRCFNRQRANIVLGHMLQHGDILTPPQVSTRERVFEQDGVLRWVDDSIVGYCVIGVSLTTLLSHLGQDNARTGSQILHHTKLSELLDIFASEPYILWLADESRQVLIVLKKGCTPRDQLRSWAHALFLAHEVQGQANQCEQEDKRISTSRITEMRRTLQVIRGVFDGSVDRLVQSGWDLDTAALETRAGARVEITK